MEKVVKVVDDYWVYASLDEVFGNPQMFRLAFSTHYSGANAENDKQVKFEVYLNRDELTNLKAML